MQFDQLKRREFVALLSGAAAWPLRARAQQPERMRRIGVLASSADDDPEMMARLAAFRQRLEKRGWSEGRNVHIETRFAAGEKYEPLAKELVAGQPDVILAHTTPAAAALQRQSRTIPIVFVNVSDPIGSGFIAGLARPGGNFTRVLLYEAGIVGKWLAMLKEIAPRLERAALVANPKTTAYDHFLRAAETVAPSLAIKLVPSTRRDSCRHQTRNRFTRGRTERRFAPAARRHHHLTSRSHHRTCGATQTARSLLVSFLCGGWRPHVLWAGCR